MVKLAEILTVCLVMPTIISQHSPLKLKEKVSIIRETATSHSIIYPISELQTVDSLFCFMPMIIKEDSEQEEGVLSNCNLEKQYGTFSCVRLYQINEAGIKYEVLDIDLNDKITLPSSTISSSTSTTASGRRDLQTAATLEILSFVNKKYEQKITFKSAPFKDKFVLVVSCKEYLSSDQDCRQWKYNYAQFYTFNYQGNILVQRYHACGIKDSKQVHIFYGGVIRDDNQYMMMGVVTKNRENSPLNMWGGIAYSNDHASRDMFCYNNKGLGHDSISFVAGAVYKDTTDNIGGKQDTTISSNSYSEQSSEAASTHFIQFYRKYETDDFIGDERIVERIYGKYSFAAYFHKFTNTELSCFNSNYNHNFVMLFYSFTDLSQNTYVLGLIELFTLICIFYLM